MTAPPTRERELLLAALLRPLQVSQLLAQVADSTLKAGQAGKQRAVACRRCKTAERRTEILNFTKFPPTIRHNHARLAMMANGRIVAAVSCDAVSAKNPWDELGARLRDVRAADLWRFHDRERSAASAGFQRCAQPVWQCGRLLCGDAKAVDSAWERRVLRRGSG